MKVSIITAFYKGNAYMSQYEEMIKKNQDSLSEEDELEAILVNDSPEVAVELSEQAALGIHVVNQERNGGIHSARVHGLLESTGDYVMFLDQDDLLAEDAIAKHLANIRKCGETTVSVSNALLEQENWQECWYRTDYHRAKVADYETYLLVGNQIISPGQCLIKKDVIPESWMSHICQKNGSDDYYLWLLLLAKNVQFSVLDEALYVHRFTASNLSADTKKMDDSTYEFLEFLKETKEVSAKDLSLIKRTVSFKDAFRGASYGKKLLLAMKNPVIFIANVVFKMKSKTPYGFNRTA